MCGRVVCVWEGSVCVGGYVCGIGLVCVGG